MPASRVVKGCGLLDPFLAKQRCRMAKRQIRLAKKNGRILDIGCGSYPLFLISVDFSEKYGLDKMVCNGLNGNTKEQGITLISSEIEQEENLPFESDYFDVVSMLAVFEHIEPRKLVKIHKEIYRVLKTGGMYLMTTPAIWTDGILRGLARMGMISKVQIDEHKGRYNHEMIQEILEDANFQSEKLRFGYFELFMNIWATAIK